MKTHAVLLTAALLLAACAKPQPQAFHVIPMPAQVTLNQGVFPVAGALVSCDEQLDDLSAKAVDRFCDALKTATGKPCDGKGKGTIHFGLNPELASEEYTIEVRPDGVEVAASALNGFVYAIETLKQMLPAAIYGDKAVKADWVLPCVSIQDQPRFAYRGAMLDPCRHFWSIEETKRFIDVITTYKLNRFHWHLSEDQGWRAEIKAYPRLTEVGAWRNGTCIGRDFDSNDGIRYGGFYTQDQMREIVAYAAERGITVIPEVDLPGHMVAALASYPELGCTGGPYEVWTRWGISQNILCAGNPDVYTFLDKVFGELVDIFPSEYIHIGGDECFGDHTQRDGLVPWDKCPKCQALMKKLHIKPGKEARHYVQNYVTARVQKMISDKGRKVIGWDEILDGELAPGATVMSWRGTKGGIKAAQKGFDVIMTPTDYLYFDYYQSKDRDNEPLAIGGFLPLEKVYGYEPFDGMKEGTEDHIQGVQCNLWTEYIATPEYLEYMLLPRLCAASEIQWCAADAKDYARFGASLDHTFEILDAMGVNYRRPTPEPQPQE